MVRDIGERDLAHYSFNGRVRSKVTELSDRAAELNVEQDLFLQGNFKYGSFEFTDYLIPTEVLGPQLLVSMSQSDYNPDVNEKIKELAENLADLTFLETMKGIKKLISIPLTYFKRRGSLGILQNLPGTLYLDDSKEIRETSPNEIMSLSVQDVYSQDRCWHEGLFSGERKDVLAKLRKENVIGYYHIHTNVSLDSPLMPSQDDVCAVARLKNLFSVNKFVLGVGDTGGRDIFYRAI
jgi:hypothetical protein